MTNKQAITVLEMIETHGSLPTKAKELAIKALKNERPTGKWIFKNDNIAIPTGYYECSNCGIGKCLIKDNFCPTCGAKMREVEE